jgi:hypothetical protein
VKEKRGMLFVTERHEFRQRGCVCLVEEQDFVYRSGRTTGQRPTALDPATVPEATDLWWLTMQTDPVLLFRFSALTANAHRIHCDTPYARDEERHPGLLVHGPLLALLMLELPRRYAPADPGPFPVLPAQTAGLRGRAPRDPRHLLRLPGRPPRRHPPGGHATAQVTLALAHNARKRPPRAPPAGLRA